MLRLEVRASEALEYLGLLKALKEDLQEQGEEPEHLVLGEDLKDDLLI